MSTPKPPLVAIVGATATGKSHIAIQLAQEFDGEIVSADSRQIYKEIPIGTGTVSEDETQGILHHLIGYTTLDTLEDSSSVVSYQQKAHNTIRQIYTRHHLPLLAGGTGMYIQAVIDNIAYPAVPPNPSLREHLSRHSTKKLFEILKQKDPQRAETIDPHNPRRLIRALEIYEATHQPTPPMKTNPLYTTLQIGISSPSNLHHLIQQRFHIWLEKGLVQEVEQLREQHNYSWDTIAQIGLEYAPISEYLQGNITHSEMIEKSIRSIQQYAKRQSVWFQKDKRIQWVATHEQAQEKVALFYKKHYTKSTFK